MVGGVLQQACNSLHNHKQTAPLRWLARQPAQGSSQCRKGISMRTLMIWGVAALLALAGYGASLLTTPAANASRVQQSATATPAPETESSAEAAAQPTSTTGMTATEALTGAADLTATDNMTGADEMTSTGEMTATTGLTTTTMPTTALAELQDSAGTVVGLAHFTETADGLQISVVISDFTAAAPGEHGIHFHQVGRCTPDFAVAGAHFNPTLQKHGLENPHGAHAGDLPNLEFDEAGNAIYETTTMSVSLNSAENGLLTADGTSLLIHDKGDDQLTDPAGMSGKRIACGVLTAQLSSPPAAPTPPPPVTGNNIQPEIRSATPERISQLQITDGFTISVFAEGLGSVRMMAEAPDGAIYVTRRGEGDVIALRDADGDGMADEPTVVADQLPSVHGIIIDEETIYLATPVTIYVGSLAADGMIDGLEPLIAGLPEAGQHGNRTMAFGEDGMLYLSVGSPCNACGITNPEYATLLQIDPATGERQIYAAGLRNTIGWGWHPETGELWGMDHGSDWRGDDQPPEELNLLEAGNNYGWPFCYGDQQIDPYLANVPPGTTKAEFCAQSTAPVLTYQAHSAPIGMVFYTGDQFPEEYQNDAFVAMRGSWNRQEPVGYTVVHIDFDEAGQPVAINDFITGWLLAEEVAHFGRVAGLLVLSDGSLLLSEDTNGVIYRIAYIGSE